MSFFHPSSFRLHPWIRRRWKTYAIVLVCFEVIVIFGGCANKLLLLPTTDPRDADSAKSRIFQHDGKTLEVFTDRSPACNGREPRAFVLEFCGNGSRAEDITAWVANQRWRRYPVEVWSLNYPGYGRSTGPATLASIPPAALATYDALRQIAGERPIFLEANSLGCTVAMYVASKRPTPGLILQNPPPIRRLILQRHGWWNLYLLATPVAFQVPAALNATTTAPDVTVPACFLLADEDELVPPAYQQLVVDAYAGKKTIIRLPYAGHNSPIDSASENQLHAWMQQLWDSTFSTPTVSTDAQ